MSSLRTLAERFREQRTDRIRVDGIEVLSLVEVLLKPTSALEVFIESHREAPQQLLSIRSRTRDLQLIEHPADRPDETKAAIELIELHARNENRVEIVGSAQQDTVLQLWNGWSIDGIGHAWMGNSGIVVEDLEPPTGANLRFRLWCSDGLGDPTFDDFVALITVGDRIRQ